VSEKYVARSRAVASRMLDGEMIVMSAIDSTLFNLNAVATLIWQAADGKTPLSQIVNDRVCQEFDVQAEAAYQDAEKLIRDLQAFGIVSIQSTPFPDDDVPSRDQIPSRSKP
jgi:hypothetical protein